MQFFDANTCEIMSIYEFLIDRLDEGVHVVDRTGKTIIYNQKMAEMESMDKQQVLNKDVLDLFTFPDEGYSTLLHALRTGSSTTNTKQTYFNQQGKPITTINHTIPITMEGKICGAAEIARDITKIEQIHENILRRYEIDHLIGTSPAIEDIIQLAKRAARTNSPILLVGETGTGKELFAQNMHQASQRSGGPFISQNCAAFPETLIESILFGTVQGAFPGAIDRPGLLEQANGGTILLDQLNVLGLPLQTKLLHALQEKVVRRLGDPSDRAIDVRVFATINEDPLDAITTGRLLKDLYYRLSVVTLFLPPLRERKEDIPSLTTYFINKYNHRFGTQVPGVSDEVMKYFLIYPWPCNVRELEHAIEGALNIATDHAQIEVIHLPLHMRRKVNMLNEFALDTLQEQSSDYAMALQGRTLQNQLEEYERAYVHKVLKKYAGNVSAAARELGVSRQSLQYRLRKWNGR